MCSILGIVTVVVVHWQRRDRGCEKSAWMHRLRHGWTLAQFVGDHQGWVPCNILAESLVVPSVAQQNDEEVELWDLVTDDLRHE